MVLSYKVKGLCWEFPRGRKRRRVPLPLERFWPDHREECPSISHAGSLHNSDIHLQSVAVDMRNAEKCNLLQGILSKSQKIRNVICWDILQSATSSHKLWVIHAYLSVFGETQLHRQVWIAAQQACWDVSLSSVGFKLPWLPRQIIMNDTFSFLKTDATMDSFFQV